ncbi:P-loop NTPase fold protein [Pseudomonas sp. UFMG81]|uniref:P-loop NTPase fold protein n=1 Tax=Pseudomonas sp. UFMG81 TaxID=2745936 RepID=UPI00188ECF68|nr:P-loop NTPase fold protein [Pseudomonas sp. UFMG81]
MDNTAVDINAHITDYLGYYLALPDPRFAVMLNGQWGIGKTHLIRAYLENSGVSTEDYTYISLYGVSTFNDIDELVIADVHPRLDGKVAKAIESLGKSTLAYFSLQTDLGRKLFFNKYKKPLYIFDDLERCGIEPDKVLGYINRFVEHEGKKAIIIANEQELDESNNYLKYREKLIGKTLSVSPPLDDALCSFISANASAQFKDFITLHTEQIKHLYQVSGISSLRILQQSLWDFERLFNTLTDRHRSHPEVLLHCLEVFFPFSFAFKAGTVSEEDIQQRPQDSVYKHFARALAEGEEPTGFEKLEKRYAGFNLRDHVLGNQDLVNTLVKGIFNAAEIEQTLSHSRFFRDESETAMQTLANAFSRSEQKFQHALATFNTEYGDLEFTCIDDVLSSFSLRLWLAEQGFIDSTADQVLAQGQAYLDSLYLQQRLLPLTDHYLTDRQYSLFSGRFYNPSWNHSESKAHRAFFEHYKGLTQRLIQDAYQHRIETLMSDMRAQPDRYVWRVSYASANSDDHMTTPVLTAIDPRGFVDTLLALPNDQQITVLAAFARRYNFTPIEPNTERTWLSALKQELEESKTGRSHFDRQRIDSLIKYYLTPYISSLYAPVDA